MDKEIIDVSNLNERDNCIYKIGWHKGIIYGFLVTFAALFLVIALSALAYFITKK